MSLILPLLRDLHRLGLRAITISGGEPFLYEELPELISHCRAQGINPDVVTNGTLSNRGLLRRLVLAGLESLVVSIDGHGWAHEQLRGPESYHKVLDTLAAAQQLGLRVRVNTVATRSTLDSIPDLIQTLSGRCWLQKIIFYTPAGSSGLPEWVEPDHWLKFVAQLEARGATLHTPVIIQQPFLSEPRPGICRLGAPFITADGRVYPCVLLAYGDQYLGSLRHKRFLDVWRQPWPIDRVHDHCIGYSYLLTGDIKARSEEILDLGIHHLGCVLHCNKCRPATLHAGVTAY